MLTDKRIVKIYQIRVLSQRNNIIVNKDGNKAGNKPPPKENQFAIYSTFFFLSPVLSLETGALGSET